MKVRSLLLPCSALPATALALLTIACGGSSSSGPSSGATSGGTTAPVALSLSDAATEDWAIIGVKLISIALIPVNGSASNAVTVYTAPSSHPSINLVQLDQLSEVLGNVQVPVGTYAKAVLTLSANPGDIYLTAAADPSTGFAGTAGATYGQASAGQVQIQGATGASGSKTVQVTVNLVSNLDVTASGSNALDLEFDLSHPAFIVDHTPPSANGSLVWAVNFDKHTVRHRPSRITDLVVRQTYGTVTSVSTDNSAMVIDKDYPTWPIASPETETTTSQSLPVQADATHGTVLYNLDASNPYTSTTVTDFSTLATLLAANTTAGKTTYVRLVTRYQSSGTLVAARVYASTSFNTVFNNPEGHVLHVNGSGSSPSFVVEDETGHGVQVNVTAATNFYFHTPLDATAGITPISGSNGGVTFMNSGLLERGFKVHTTVDPSTANLAQRIAGNAVDVDIEIAKYQGIISNANSTSFDYSSVFPTIMFTGDNYSDFALPYISSNTANGIDPANGDAYTGFKWWDVGYPSLINPTSTSTDSAAAAIQSFVAGATGAVDFGGTPDISAKPYGVSYATWADPANPSGWSARFTIMEPTPLPLGTVATGAGWSLSGSNATFGMTVLGGGTTAQTVQLNTAAQSAPLVYQVDRSNGVVTISQVDITTANGQLTAAAGLTPGHLVKVYGIPQSANGSGYMMAYLVFYYTGTTPQS